MHTPAYKSCSASLSPACKHPRSAYGPYSSPSSCPGIKPHFLSQMNTHFQRGQALWWLSYLKESISSDGILGTGRNEVVGAAEGWVVCVLGCFHSNSNLTVRALEGRAVIARATPSYPVHLGLMVKEGRERNMYSAQPECTFPA